MLFAPALLALALQTPAQAPTTLADLVPKDTIAFVQAPSLERAAQFVGRLMQAFGPRGGPKIEVATLLAMVEAPGDVSAIDPARPVGLCVLLDEMEGAQPLPAFLIPVRDADAYLKSVTAGGKGMQGVAKGGYVCVGLGAAPELPSAPAAIARGLPEGEIAARLDLGRLIDQYGELIDQGLNEIEAQADSLPASATGGIDAKPMMGAYVDWIRDVVDSAETLDLAVRLEGDELELGFALTNAEGSALASFGSKEKTGLRALAPLLDADAACGVLMGMDMAAMSKRFQPLLDSTVAIYPEPLRPGMQQAFSHIGEFYGLIGSAMCASVDFAPSGMRYSAYFPCKEPQKLLESYRKLMQSMPGFGMTELPEREVGGLKLAGFRVKMDLTKLLEQAGDQTPKDQMDAMMERLFGKDGMAFQIASKDGLTAVILGGDDEFLRASIARMSSKSAPPPKFARALQQVGDMNPCMIARYDLGRMMGGFKELLAGIAPDAGIAIPELALAPMVWGGVDGRVWRGALAANLSEIAALTHLGDAPPGDKK